MISSNLNSIRYIHHDTPNTKSSRLLASCRPRHHFAETISYALSLQVQSGQGGAENLRHVIFAWLRRGGWARQARWLSQAGIVKWDREHVKSPGKSHHLGFLPYHHPPGGKSKLDFAYFCIVILSNCHWHGPFLHLVILEKLWLHEGRILEGFRQQHQYLQFYY